MGCEHENHCQKFKIGVTTVFLHDTSRSFNEIGLGIFDTDPNSPTYGALLTPDTRGTFTLVTNIYYPASSKKMCRKLHKKAHFWDFYFATGPNDTAAYDEFLTGISIDGYDPESNVDMDPNSFYYNYTFAGDVLSNTDPRYVKATKLAFKSKLDSYVDAPIADGKFPVILMSHGIQDCRVTFYRVAQYLASQGYIVVVPDYTGIANLTVVSKDPDFLKYNAFLVDPAQPGYPFLDSYGAYQFNLGISEFAIFEPNTPGQAIATLQETNYYMKSVISALKSLKELKLAGDRIAKHMDFDRGVGLAGHSFGSIASLLLSSLLNDSKIVLPVKISATFAYVGFAFEAEFFRALPPSIDLSSFPLLDLILNYLKQPIIIKPSTYFLTGREDSTITPVCFEYNYLNLQSEQPNTDNQEPPLKRLFDTTTKPTFYATYTGLQHNGLNDFYPFPMFSPELNPRMPTNLLTPSFYSLYDSDDDLLIWGPDYTPPSPPFVSVVPPDQIQAEKSYNFLTQNFFDAYLKSDKDAVTNLTTGNGDTNIKQQERNVKC